MQQANGIKANGILSNRVRAALNKEGEPKKADPKRNIDRLIANMERWRWLPADLGVFLRDEQHSRVHERDLEGRASWSSGRR